MDREELLKSDFWRRKIRMAGKIRDTNKDGFLSRDDFDFVERYRELGVPEDRLSKLEKEVDVLCKSLGIVDDTTRIPLEEHIVNFAKTKISIEELTQNIATMFDIIDSDGNGTISFKEWVDFYTVFRIDTKYARASFDAMDTDGDGVISREEFLAYNKEYYHTTEDKLHSSIMYGPLD